MQKALEYMENFYENEDGATAIEYGLLTALIAGAIIVTVTTLGNKVSTSLYSNLEKRLP
jgi:pilus assembly protein Flp/PilA